MFVFKKYDRQNHVWSFMTKYLRFLCKFTSWSCGCIEKQIRCWKNCWYSYNIDKCNKILCLSSRNMIDKNHVWSFMTKYLRFLCKFTSWSCGCIEKQIRCWKNCWYSYNIDKCNKMLCLFSRNMIDKTMWEVLWRNISDFYVNLRVEVGKHPHVDLAMHFYLGQE